MMKKTVLFMAGCLIPIFSYAQSVSGRVVDEHAQPVPFVNVVLLSRADSAFVQGTVTKNDGRFSIETDRKDGMLKVSSVGYATSYVNLRQGGRGGHPDTP